MDWKHGTSTWYINWVPRKNAICWISTSYYKRRAQCISCRLPYYSVIKLAFILWLHLPQYSGAARLSRQLFRPLLRVLHPYFTAVLNALDVYRQRPEVLAAENVFHGIAGQIPVLEWFIRGPDGRPRLRNRKANDWGFEVESFQDFNDLEVNNT